MNLEALSSHICIEAVNQELVDRASNIGLTLFDKALNIVNTTKALTIFEAISPANPLMGNIKVHIYNATVIGIKPIGLAARDTLRVEMGYCLYGNDINDTTSPLEAGLGWITKFNKEFVNSDHLKAQKETGITKKLVAFELTERGIPRHNYTIVDEEGKQIGVVTSGTMSPSLSKGIGMGYVPKEISKPGTKIFIQVRKKQIPATIVKLPFYKG